MAADAASMSGVSRRCPRGSGWPCARAAARPQRAARNPQPGSARSSGTSPPSRVRDLGPLVHYRRPATVQQLAQLAAVSLLCGDAQLACGHRQLCTAAPTVWALSRAGGLAERSAARRGRARGERYRPVRLARAKQLSIARGSNLLHSTCPQNWSRSENPPRAIDLCRVAVAAAALFRNAAPQRNRSPARAVAPLAQLAMTARLRRGAQRSATKCAGALIDVHTFLLPVVGQALSIVAIGKPRKIS